MTIRIMTLDVSVSLQLL